MQLLEWIEQIDKQVFSFINAQAYLTELDVAMKLFRNAATWIPLYAFMIFWAFKKAPKHTVTFILLTVATVALTDFTSASILKPILGRQRPCYDPELSAIIRNLVGCGGEFSLPSSHAANHFGLATFWFITIKKMVNQKWWWLFIWAFIIGYAQIYVGKHYPLDIIVGAAFGWFVGFSMSKLFDFVIQKSNARNSALQNLTKKEKPV